MPKKTKIIQVPMPEELVESLDELAYEAGESRAHIIREAAATYVTRVREADKVRRYVESYIDDPEDDAWGEVGAKLAAEVWKPEDWTEEYQKFLREQDAPR